MIWYKAYAMLCKHKSYDISGTPHHALFNVKYINDTIYAQCKNSGQILRARSFGNVSALRVLPGLASQIISKILS